VLSLNQREVMLLQKFRDRRRHHERRSGHRRWHWLLGVAVTLFLFGGTITFYAFFIEPKTLHVRAVDVPLAAWPASAGRVRVAALADIHVGSPYIDLKKLDQIVEKTNAAEPDIVVLLGDYMILGVLGGNFIGPEPIAERLAHLKAPGGVYAVMGNHDWWVDGFRTIKAFQEAGIRVLEDEAVQVGLPGGRSFWLAGFADLWTRRPDIEKALAPVPANAPILGITHNPDIFPQLPERVALTFAGHTHGGQVYVPFIGRPVVPSRFRQKFAVGLIEQGGKDLFVSPGIGSSILPVRFLVPPEISLVTVQPAP